MALLSPVRQPSSLATSTANSGPAHRKMSPQRPLRSESDSLVLFTMASASRRTRLPCQSTILAAMTGSNGNGERFSGTLLPSGSSFTGAEAPPVYQRSSEASGTEASGESIVTWNEGEWSIVAVDGREGPTYTRATRGGGEEERRGNDRSLHAKVHCKAPRELAITVRW